MGEKEILRYLSLVARRLEIIINSCINWKPEYDEEMKSIDKEIAQLRVLINAEHIKRDSIGG